MKNVVMKSLPEFGNLKIGEYDIIVVAYPLEKELTSLTIEKKTKNQLAKDFPFARPLVVASVGSKIAAGESEFVKFAIERGDFVYMNDHMVSMGNLLAMDEDRRWMNPIIITNAAVVAVVVNGEEWEKEYEGIAIKIETLIKEKEKRMTAKGNLIK